jgi:hypothetical protein
MSGVKRCGEFGHVGKNGLPCQYKIYGQATCCPHHDEDKARQTTLLAKARAGGVAMRLPEAIDLGGLQTLADLKRGFSQVVRNAATEKHVDLKRLDVIIRALNGANAVLQTEATKELTDTLLKLDGQAAGVMAVQRLKEAQVLVLPKRKSVLKTEGTV